MWTWWVGLLSRVPVLGLNTNSKLVVVASILIETATDGGVLIICWNCGAKVLGRKSGWADSLNFSKLAVVASLLAGTATYGGVLVMCEGAGGAANCWEGSQVDRFAELPLTSLC